MTIFGVLSNEGKTLAPFRVHHFRSTLIYSWTLLEEQVNDGIESQHMYGGFGLLTNSAPCEITPRSLPSRQSQ